MTLHWTTPEEDTRLETSPPPWRCCRGSRASSWTHMAGWKWNDHAHIYTMATRHNPILISSVCLSQSVSYAQFLYPTNALVRQKPSSTSDLTLQIPVSRSTHTMPGRTYPSSRLSSTVGLDLGNTQTQCLWTMSEMSGRSGGVGSSESLWHLTWIHL